MFTLAIKFSYNFPVCVHVLCWSHPSVNLWVVIICLRITTSDKADINKDKSKYKSGIWTTSLSLICLPDLGIYEYLQKTWV